eukprot:scaffold520734_cov48-Prasinocladus_malaysianus.AAC.1
MRRSWRPSQSTTLSRKKDEAHRMVVDDADPTGGPESMTAAASGQQCTGTTREIVRKGNASLPGLDDGKRNRGLEHNDFPLHMSILPLFTCDVVTLSASEANDVGRLWVWAKYIIVALRKIAAALLRRRFFWRKIAKEGTLYLLAHLPRALLGADGDAAVGRPYGSGSGGTPCAI